ncbi:MAG TPA: carboxypeptidase regulatory-like domain-containing protein [Pyrinomonadaceae bacterium]|nr:carboxypeptidase regulatory-like domain-containing protein [Pyrinomonadaceae bacterium]
MRLTQRLITELFSPILLIFALFSSLLAQAPVQNSQAANKTELDQASTANSLVTGRAVYEDTGLPATRHRVQLIASELLSGPHARFRIPTAITSENGDFSLRRIAAGEYYVVARTVDQHPAGEPLFPYQGQSGDSAVDVAKVEQFKKDYTRIVVDGQHNLAVNLRVPNPHFGTISGRILESSGRPAVHAFVHLMSSGEKSFGATVLTDEQGEYRFWGLPAGEYVISASPPAQRRDEGEPTRRYEGVLGATYFPSTLQSRNSPPVTVFADRDTGNIEVMLIARGLHSLAGMVRMRGDNQPVSSATVRLTRNEISDQVSGTSQTPGIEGAMSIYFSATDKSGHWWIANVPDGAYRLRVQSMASAPTNQLFVQQELDLTVEGADIENLLVEVSGGSRISGVVSIEGNNPSPQFVRVSANRFKGNASCHVRLDEAGKFALTAVPTGAITLSAFPSPQDKFYVKSIEANGLDLLRNDLTIAEGEEIKDVRIVISPNVGVVAGSVLSLKGNKPIAGINVLLRRVSDDKSRLLGGKLMTSTDDRGNFILSAAPGVYLVLAWRATGGPSAFADAMDRALREQGSGLTLLPSDRKRLDIRVP